MSRPRIDDPNRFSVPEAVGVLLAGGVIAGVVTVAGTIATGVALVFSGAGIFMCPDDDGHVDLATSVSHYATPTLVAMACAGFVWLLLSRGFRIAGLLHPRAIACGYAVVGTLAYLMSWVVTAYFGSSTQGPNAPCSQEHPAAVPSWMTLAWYGALALVFVASVVVNVTGPRMPSEAR
jgi:hypothetical protein